MKALSLTQPWASLMALNEKGNETRDWQTTFRGELAIASSKGFPGACADLCWMEPYWSVLNRHGVTFGSRGKVFLSLGVVLCVVDVVGCVSTSKIRERAAKGEKPKREFELDFGDYSDGREDKGRYAIITSNLRVLVEPVPVEHMEKGAPKAGGALGLYDLSPACEAAVRAQLRSAA